VKGTPLTEESLKEMQDRLLEPMKICPISQLLHPDDYFALLTEPTIPE
jgi:hypothetical protein